MFFWRSSRVEMYSYIVSKFLVRNHSWPLTRLWLSFEPLLEKSHDCTQMLPCFFLGNSTHSYRVHTSSTNPPAAGVGSCCSWADAELPSFFSNF